MPARERIRLKRAYEAPEPTDGARFLVDRLWPRGIQKSALEIEAWPKEVAPSVVLRRWFGHDPKRWPEFERRYFAELEGNESAWRQIADAAGRGPVTLVYAARDPEHNNAVVLRRYLEGKLKRR